MMRLEETHSNVHESPELRGSVLPNLECPLDVCAVTRRLFFQWVQAPPGDRSTGSNRSRQRSTCGNRPTRTKHEISRPTAELVSNRRWRSCRRHGTCLFGTHAERFEDVRAKRVDKRNIGGVASSRD